MRERKLRAFNKRTKEMCTVNLICFVNRYVDVLPDRELEGGSQESWPFDEIELMDFVGLTDKSGKEIYEGDVVEVHNKGYRNGTKVIIWDEIQLCYVVVWAKCFDQWTGSSCGITYDKVTSNLSCSVIGNRFERPELLVTH